jgi:predicted DNA-binding transcriptional regulator YafY
VGRPDDYRTAIGWMDMIRHLEASPERSRPVNWLADKLGVDRRTIRRWAQSQELLGEAEDGAPGVVLLRGSPGREATVRLARPHNPASRARLRAAALALAATRYLAATGAELLDEMAERLLVSQAGFDPETLRRARSAFHYIPFGRKSYVDKPDEVDAVFTAILSRCTLDFDYWIVDRQRSVRIRVEPYTIVIYRDALYVLGRRMGWGEPVMRVYAIDRMSNPQHDRAARFDVPADFDPKDHFGDLGLWNPGGPPERLEVAFANTAARYAREREWPGSPAWHPEPDGRQRLQLDIRISKEVEQWLLGFGPDAEVIAPGWLRARMRENVAQMAERYAREGPGPA